MNVKLTPEDVRASWGEPERVETDGPTETWFYPASSRVSEERQTTITFREGKIISLTRI